ncbi:MAG: ester cyclase [Actinobacteria bacterium]|nr:ester cyclase [Actinomycetota bacterium]
MYGNAEENKAIVLRHWEEVVSKGTLDLIDEIFAPDFVAHEADQDIRGPEGVRQFILMLRAAFPDLRVTVEDVLAEGVKVVQRWRAHGSHQGELMGLAPTGKRISVAGITISRFEGGKVAEEWELYDMIGMMQQLGAIPSSTEQQEEAAAVGT